MWLNYRIYNEDVEAKPKNETNFNEKKATC